MTKKMKSKEVVPHASPKTNSKAARARRSATRAVPIAHWDERDIHFDDQGRVTLVRIGSEPDMGLPTARV